MLTLLKYTATCFGIILMLGSANADWREAGPIWGDFDAQRKCPNVCGRDKWDGNWKTTQMGRKSVCKCLGGSTKGLGGSGVLAVDAGPIWGNFDARGKCLKACGNRKWDGNWRTVGPGRSTCDCIK